jgi:5,10-methylenetetrahydromethanopterin reductase
MDFSFCVLPDYTSREIVKIAQRAEAAGIPMVWVADETFMRDPYALLGAIAASTEKIRLGIGIANPYTRHPIQVARAAATVAELCNRPVTLGIGAGLKSTRAAMGVPAGDFVNTTRDMILAIKAVLAGQRFSIENEVFRFNDIHMEFRTSVPVDIYVASTHPKAFVMAGEVADGVIVGNVGQADAMSAIVKSIHEAAQSAGRSAMYDVIRGVTARTIANSHSQTSEMLRIERPTVEKIRKAVREQPSLVTRDLVPDEFIDRYAIVGSVDECIARLVELRNAGATIAAVRPSTELQRVMDYEGMVHRLWAGFQQGNLL